MEVMGGRGIGNLEIKWENNILKNFKESSHRLAKLEYNTLRWRSIEFCAHKIQTTKSRKLHTYTSQIPVIQYHPLHSLLNQLMSIVYSLNIPCSSLPQSLSWTPGFFFLNCFPPGSLHGQSLFIFQVSIQHFIISERTLFTLLCKFKPSVLFSIQKRSFIPLNSNRQDKIILFACFVLHLSTFINSTRGKITSIPLLL